MNENKLGTAKNPLKSKSNAMRLIDGNREMTHEDVIFDSIIWHLRNSINNGKQYLSGGDCETYFRELVKKVKENDMETKVEATGFIQVGKTVAVIFNDVNYDDEVELQLGDYEIKIRDGKTYAVRKKSAYPTTYEECCEKLGIEEDLWFVYEDIDGNHINPACISNYRIRGLELYHNLEKLKICRDAYRKIAGEQMGLDKPWEPDWTSGKPFYCISVSGNTIGKGKWYTDNKILTFPTEEMRDAFYENFKDLIESCKELL